VRVINRLDTIALNNRKGPEVHCGVPDSLRAVDKLDPVALSDGERSGAPENMSGGNSLRVVDKLELMYREHVWC